MKILQVITELQPAGAERIVAKLSTALKTLGNEIMVVSIKALPENSEIVEQLRRQQITIKTLNMGKYQPWRIFSLSHIIKHFAPDIVHSHLIHANVISRLNNCCKKHLLVNTVHTCERRYNKAWHFWLDRLTFSLCHCQTVVSKAVNDFHSSKIGVSRETMPVIYNGIEPPKKLSLGEIKELRKAWGIENCHKIIGSIGRLHQDKGYDLLLHLLPELSKKIPLGQKWAIVILGEGSYRNSLEELCKNSPTNIQIKLPGFRMDAADCIGAFDLFVMPSRYEGFGLTLAEAMTHGIPILANEIDSLPEVLENYNNGKTIDFVQLEKEQISKKIVEMANDSFTKGVIFCDHITMVQQYWQLYKKLSSP